MHFFVEPVPFIYKIKPECQNKKTVEGFISSKIKTSVQML